MLQQLQVDCCKRILPPSCFPAPLLLSCTGNSGISLRQEVPAACPGTLVVTAISDNDGSVGAADKPPSWSNYLPLPDTDNIAARMLAAPGRSCLLPRPFSVQHALSCSQLQRLAPVLTCSCPSCLIGGLPQRPGRAFHCQRYMRCHARSCQDPRLCFVCVLVLLHPCLPLPASACSCLPPCPPLPVPPRPYPPLPAFVCPCLHPSAPVCPCLPARR